MIIPFQSRHAGYLFRAWIVTALLCAACPPAWAYGPYSDHGDGTVSDAETGLMWQKSGTNRQYSMDEACLLCEDLELAGYDDWRLPRIDELRTIIDYQRDNPSIDPVFNAVSFSYWSATTGAYGNPLNPWIVRFLSGRVEGAGANESHYVRCVRGGPNWTLDPSDNLVFEGDGQVRDLTTGLVWQRVADGIERGFTEARTYCEQLAEDGLDDWRLPAIEELQTIVDYTQNNPAISTEVFDGPTGDYWSGTLSQATSDHAWSVVFRYGDTWDYYSLGEESGEVGVLFDTSASRIFCRCVRGDFALTLDEPEPDGVRTYLDIKPGSCDNPVNLSAQGVLPVAVCGTDTFDAETVDPASIRLAGAAGVGSVLEDVISPPAADADPEACVDDGPDGIPDLVVKFDVQALAAVLEDVTDGESRILTLTGTLLDGTPFEVQDRVTLIAKEKPGKVQKNQDKAERNKGGNRRSG